MPNRTKLERAQLSACYQTRMSVECWQTKQKRTLKCDKPNQKWVHCQHTTKQEWALNPAMHTKQERLIHSSHSQSKPDESEDWEKYLYRLLCSSSFQDTVQVNPLSLSLCDSNSPYSLALVPSQAKFSNRQTSMVRTLYLKYLAGWSTHVSTGAALKLQFQFA